MSEVAAILSEHDLAALGKKVRITSKRSKLTETLLKTHIDECAKRQLWVLRVGAATFGWVVLHSPEAALALAKIVKVIVP